MNPKSAHVQQVQKLDLRLHMHGRGDGIDATLFALKMQVGADRQWDYWSRKNLYAAVVKELPQKQPWLLVGSLVGHSLSLVTFLRDAHVGPFSILGGAHVLSDRCLSSLCHGFEQAACDIAHEGVFLFNISTEAAQVTSKRRSHPAEEEHAHERASNTQPKPEPIPSGLKTRAEVCLHMLLRSNADNAIKLAEALYKPKTPPARVTDDGLFMVPALKFEDYMDRLDFALELLSDARLHANDAQGKRRKTNDGRAVGNASGTLTEDQFKKAWDYLHDRWEAEFCTDSHKAHVASVTLQLERNEKIKKRARRNCRA